MFKIIGMILIMFSTVFVFSQKLLEYRATYRFVLNIAEIIERMRYENAANQTYEKVFEKLNINPDKLLNNAKSNGYIQQEDIKAAYSFFDGLGKRDRTAENEYIIYGLKNFRALSEKYLQKYNETKKTHLLCGISLGMVIIIFLI